MNKKNQVIDDHSNVPKEEIKVCARLTLTMCMSDVKNTVRNFGRDNDGDQSPLAGEATVTVFNLHGKHKNF